MLQVLNAKRGNRCHEKNSGTASIMILALQPAPERFLGQFLSISDDSNDAVCDGKQQWPVVLKDLRGLWIRIALTFSSHIFKPVDGPCPRRD